MYFQQDHHSTLPSRSRGRRRASLSELEIIAIKLAASNLINDIALSGIPTSEAAVEASLKSTKIATPTVPDTVFGNPSPTFGSFRNSISRPLLNRLRGNSHKKSQEPIEVTVISSGIDVNSNEKDVSSSLPTTTRGTRALSSPVTHLTYAPGDLDSIGRHFNGARTASAPTIPSHHLPRLSQLLLTRRSKAKLATASNEEERERTTDDDHSPHLALKSGQAVGETTAGIFTSAFGFHSQWLEASPDVVSSTESSPSASWSSRTTPEVRNVDLPEELERQGEAHHPFKQYAVLAEVTSHRPALFRSLSHFLSHSSHPSPSILESTDPSKEEREEGQSSKLEEPPSPMGHIRRIMPRLHRWQEALTTTVDIHPAITPIATLSAHPLFPPPTKPMRSPLRPSLAMAQTHSTPAIPTLLPSDFAFDKQTSRRPRATTTTNTVLQPPSSSSSTTTTTTTSPSLPNSPSRLHIQLQLNLPIDLPTPSPPARKVKRRPVQKRSGSSRSVSTSFGGGGGGRSGQMGEGEGEREVEREGEE